MCLLILCLPILLFALVVVVSTPPLSSYDESQSNLNHFETSADVFLLEYMSGWCSFKDNITLAPPLIHLGSVNTQWYDGVLITQNRPSNPYTFTNMSIYLVPAERVVKHSTLFYCEERAFDIDLLLHGVYLFNDVTMTFNICIESRNLMDTGWTNLSIYDDVVNYSNRNNGGKYLEQVQFLVNASETKCYVYSFTTPHDSYYYIALGANYELSKNVTVTYYEMDVEMEYVNASDWGGVAQMSTCKYTPSVSKCHISLHNADIRSVFGGKNYEIFGQVTTPTSEYVDIVGYVSVQPTFRKMVYILPTVAGLILFVPFEIVCIISTVVCYCRRKEQRLV